MGYQFLHIEGYARKGSQQSKNGKLLPRKWSTQEIANEAEREPNSCPHVANPQPPKLLYGCSPREVVQIAEKWASTSVDASGRKLRSDGLALAAGVVSLSNEQQQDWPRYREATVHWLKEQYGERLRSVIEHVDEAHPHLHFYAVPLVGERFETLHKGRQAAYEAKLRGGVKGEQNEAYKAAMRAWQDDFNAAIASNFGLARLGPARRRLKRGEWQSEKAQARNLSGQLVKPKFVTLKPEEVARRVEKSGLLGKQYESDEVTAARLTRIMSERTKPLVNLAKRAEFHSGQAERLQVQLEAQQQQTEQAEQRAQQAEAIASLFTPEQIESARQVQRERLRLAAERAEAEKAAGVEALRRQEIAAERQRRIDALPGLLRNVVGAAATFVQHSLDALRLVEGDASRVEWTEIEGSAAILAMRENGQEPESVARALCELSPIRADPETYVKVHEWCQRVGPSLAQEYEQRRAARDTGLEL